MNRTLTRFCFECREWVSVETTHVSKPRDGRHDVLGAELECGCFDADRDPGNILSDRLVDLLSETAPHTIRVVA